MGQWEILAMSRVDEEVNEEITNGGAHTVPPLVIQVTSGRYFLMPTTSIFLRFLCFREAVVFFDKSDGPIIYIH